MGIGWTSLNAQIKYYEEFTCFFKWTRMVACTISKVKFSLQYSIYFECLDIFGKQVVLQISCEIESERAFFLDMGMVQLPG